MGAEFGVPVAVIFTVPGPTPESGAAVNQLVVWLVGRIDTTHCCPDPTLTAIFADVV
jgi:hypothetical protein